MQLVSTSAIGMRYDLTLIRDFCVELGITNVKQSKYLLEIELLPDAVLIFQNADRDKDCSVGFKGTPWHTHGD